MNAGEIDEKAQQIHAAIRESGGFGMGVEAITKAIRSLPTFDDNNMLIWPWSGESGKGVVQVLRDGFNLDAKDITQVLFLGVGLNSDEAAKALRDGIQLSASDTAKALRDGGELTAAEVAWALNWGLGLEEYDIAKALRDGLELEAKEVAEALKDPAQLRLEPKDVAEVLYSGDGLGLPGRQVVSLLHDVFDLSAVEVANVLLSPECIGMAVEVATFALLDSNLELEPETLVKLLGSPKPEGCQIPLVELGQALTCDFGLNYSPERVSCLFFEGLDLPKTEVVQILQDAFNLSREDAEMTLFRGTGVEPDNPVSMNSAVEIRKKRQESKGKGIK